ncbi:MAG: VanZ family protein, partial [Candidatus Zixiibacteriota bacterium]
KEKRLWVATGVVILAIYSTLALASKLAPFVRGLGIEVWLFIVGCLMVLVTVVIHGLKTRPTGAGVIMALGIVAAYLFIFVRMASPVERSHLIEYSVVAVFIYEALLERKRNGGGAPVPWLMAISLTTVLGVFDELIQLVIPSRVFDPLDLLFNFTAGVMAVGGSSLLRWISDGKLRSSRDT